MQNQCAVCNTMEDLSYIETLQVWLCKSHTKSCSGVINIQVPHLTSTLAFTSENFYHCSSCVMLADESNTGEDQEGLIEAVEEYVEGELIPPQEFETLLVTVEDLLDKNTTHEFVDLSSIIEEPDIDYSSYPSCKFFTPSQSMVAEYQSDTPRNWPYTKLPFLPTCTNNIMRNEETGQWGNCLALNCQPTCGLYTPDTQAINTIYYKDEDGVRNVIALVDGFWANSENKIDVGSIVISVDDPLPSSLEDYSKDELKDLPEWLVTWGLINSHSINNAELIELILEHGYILSEPTTESFYAQIRK